MRVPRSAMFARLTPHSLDDSLLIFIPFNNQRATE
jgi:hypothetical protein